MSVLIAQDAKVLLASSSPRRVTLLEQIGVKCEVFPVDIDESVYENEQAKSYVLRLARQKAEACLSRIDDERATLPILAADTTVVFSAKIFGKPRSPAHAIEMLQILSGQVHHVHTSVALLYQSEIHVVVSTTAVEMMPLSISQIDAYVQTGEHAGKAGAYAIQGEAATWIKRIDGSYSGVMGLPLYETANLLRTIGFLK